MNKPPTSKQKIIVSLVFLLLMVMAYMGILLCCDIFGIQDAFITRSDALAGVMGVVFYTFVRDVWGFFE